MAAMDRPPAFFYSPAPIRRPAGRPFSDRGIMRLSAYFMPTLKETPAEAQIVSHRLMLGAGMVRQASAGIYSWLPLGFRVLKRIGQIVRWEQDPAGCHELRMPQIQQAAVWRQ